MTLLAKNSNRLFIAGLIAIAVLFAGCKDQNKPTPTPTEKDLFGNVARPTWTVPEDYDYTCSMTAVIAVRQLCGVALKDSTVGPNDLLAAFSGETCLGIATYDDGLFFLFVAGPTANSQELTANITLRYWSAHYTNLFETEPISFVNDNQLGTTAAPYMPVFEATKK